jgi:hypothetical protein
MSGGQLVAAGALEAGAPDAEAAGAALEAGALDTEAAGAAAELARDAAPAEWAGAGCWWLEWQADRPASAATAPSASSATAVESLMRT